MSSADINFSFKEKNCVKLHTDKYTCIISPDLGASVLRLHDDKNGIEVFRYNDKVTIDEIDNQREIWGLPTLYLPNRFYKGIIKTSDGVYKMPINESEFNNFIHGWVHKRVHNVESYNADNEKAVLVTSYTFDSNDEMYKYFPLDFKISYKFTLSNNGLLQEIYLTNESRKMLPVSICTHTCINAPMTDGGKESDMKLFVSIGEKCELNDTLNPTEKLISLNDWDREYITGKRPTGQIINNDMYIAKMNKYNNKDFYGVIISDEQSGHFICNEVSPEYKFWNMWNDGGKKGYFCPEPMTAMINSPNLSLDRSVTGYKEIGEGETFICWQRFFTE
ncbi:MAG: aldose 1-epimerase [Oscillospiraceae bacterium]